MTFRLFVRQCKTMSRTWHGIETRASVIHVWDMHRPQDVS
ncbi:hypothetical protein F383_36350 [Gossypium arboreum]|uniref:Uncharacterized protein n=1 Tax=Gossypium arboreum TaxID=29729 RepID=A0A0B0N3X5_GOSAR|nr:hypothetical protein F383_36350 [Gossypium arboreum]